MKYEVVELNTKLMVGKSIITSNSDPTMGEQIFQLWQQFYDPSTGYCLDIKNKVDWKALALYSDYIDGKYSVTVGLEVDKCENTDMVTKTIIKGKYAKFAIHGNMVTSVAKAWGDIWATPLERTFTGDFEEYLPCDDCDHVSTCNSQTCQDCNINIYVAIK